VQWFGLAVLAFVLAIGIALCGLRRGREVAA